MAVYFGSNKVSCGYLGTQPLANTFFGTEMVCSGVKLPITPPDSTDTTTSAKVFRLYFKSSNYYTPRQLLAGANISTSSSAWHIAKDVDDWYLLTCIAPITAIRFNSPLAGLTDIYMYLNAHPSSHLVTEVSFYHAFEGLADLETFNMNRVGGIITDMVYAFANCPKLKYVQYSDSTFYPGTANYLSTYYNCPKLKYISNVSTQMGESINYMPHKNHMFDGCISLIRPSADEIVDLISTAGGLSHYNIDHPYKGKIKYQAYKIIFTKTASMDTFLTITEMKIFDEFGAYIAAPNLVASSTLSSSDPINNINDGTYNTKWVAHGALPQWITFEQTIPFIISEIRFGVKVGSRSPTAFEIYGKNANGTYTRVKSISTNRTLLGNERKTFAVNK